MTQLSFDAVVTHGMQARLRFYAGYCFGWRAASLPLSKWVHAVVVTPRWVSRALADVDEPTPFILDNGAFPAWRDGVDLSLSDQLDGLNQAVEQIGVERIRFVVWPDVVGNPVETERRIAETLRCFDHPIGALIPLQEGMMLVPEARLALELNGGVFVGGRTRAWKLRTAQYLRRLFPSLHIHIARISSEGHLHSACMCGATSFDTTTFMRKQGTNQRTDYTKRLELYAMETM